MKLSRQTRREFCTQACQAVALATIGSALQGCGAGAGLTSPSSAAALSRVSGTVASGVISLTIDASSPLASVGSAALVQTSSGLFLVARTGQDTFSALTATCTHEACTVSGFENQHYICPCHGSEYTTSGAVVKGPAPAPLRQFATRFTGGVLTITIA